MVSREQAVSLARDFLERSGRAVDLDSPEVRRMEAARMNRLFGHLVYPSDSWVVEFSKVLPPGVTECPGTVTVEVLEATGQLREVVVDMCHEWTK